MYKDIILENKKYSNMKESFFISLNSIKQFKSPFLFMGYKNIKFFYAWDTIYFSYVENK